MSSHLSSEQLALLAGRLRDRYVTLHEEVHQHLMDSGDENYIEIAGQVHDRADEAVAERLADLNYNVIKTQVAEMRAIEKALSDIQQRVYGLCSDCSVEIPYSRLKVFPTAVRCVNCQQAVEEKLHQLVHH